MWPDISADWTHIDRGPDRSAKAQAMKVFDDLDVLDWRAIGAKRDRGPDGDEEGLPYLRFGIDAYDLFVDWRTPLERLLRSSDPTAGTGNWGEACAKMDLRWIGCDIEEGGSTEVMV